LYFYFLDFTFYQGGIQPLFFDHSSRIIQKQCVRITGVRTHVYLYRCLACHIKSFSSGV